MEAMSSTPVRNIAAIPEADVVASPTSAANLRSDIFQRIPRHKGGNRSMYMDNIVFLAQDNLPNFARSIEEIAGVEGISRPLDIPNMIECLMTRICW